MNIFLKVGKYSCIISFVFLLLGSVSEYAFAGCVYADNLSVTELNMGNLLKWSTSEETQTDFFIVYKSEDGLSFDAIGELKAMGNSDERKDYRFLDSSTGDQKVFYRLLQVDMDDHQAFTPIVFVQKKQSNNFVVTTMSNTTTDRYFNVALKSEDSGHMAYQLVNKKKEIVKRGVIRILKGDNLFTLDMDGIVAGKYQFVFSMKEEEESLLLIKLIEEMMVIKK